jgi:hypothetical protein
LNRRRAPLLRTKDDLISQGENLLPYATDRLRNIRETARKIQLKKYRSAWNLARILQNSAL